jgi:hypothetical protein
MRMKIASTLFVHARATAVETAISARHTLCTHNHTPSDKGLKGQASAQPTARNRRFSSERFNISQ